MKIGPFIYIAALRRTGSTLLSEALTYLPYSFILREPNLSRNRFSIKPNDSDILKKYGVDLLGFKEKWSGAKKPSLLEAFKGELLPQIYLSIEQFGVKEIRHSGWQKYKNLFEGMKVLLTGRDPRDIYLSLHGRVTSGLTVWKGVFSPETVACELNREFRNQLDINDACECLKVRYEDFCSDPDIFCGIKRFIGSRAPDMGRIGEFNSQHPKRVEEFKLHGNCVTRKSVNRWIHEPDSQLVYEAKETMNLMSEYCEFWDYKK